MFLKIQNYVFHVTVNLLVGINLPPGENTPQYAVVPQTIPNR